MPPYLSVIVVGRNDDYGKNFLHRLQLFVHNQINLWNKYDLDAELIIVEWNPPEDKPRFREAFTWPSSKNPIRIIEVTSDIHKEIAGQNRSPLFEFIGKNVGVERAHGQYILATNPDLLYSEELISFFAQKKLQDNCFYRVDRHDFAGITISLALPAEKQIGLARAHVVAINNNYGASFLKNEKVLSWRSLRRVATYVKNVLTYFPYQPPYANAAGDFFLMHRRHWHHLRGYPEINFGLCDAILYNATSSGLKQVILKWPLAIFHGEHDHQGGARVPSDLEMNKRQYLKIIRERKPWIPNDESWGLNNETLPEWRM